ncbi:transcription factor IIA, alpha/beta subunit [Xylariaceae sp. FL1272]|nr:transcription factor IIA, alpha/beta subunit [Xylariaceae sp. FL1272]
MSNNQVGSVYQQIINDVITASRVDFEEGGVDDIVLEELKRGWQKKLSQQQLAVFPWDPKPEPVAAPAPLPPVAQQPVSNPSVPPTGAHGNGYMQPQPTMAQQPVQMPVAATQPELKPEPSVKIEPGQDGLQIPQGLNSAHVNPQGNAGQARAIANMQALYGDRAAASISKMKEQPQNPQQRTQTPIMPQGYPQYQSHPHQQYQQNPPGQQQQQRPPMANAHRPPNSQMDGTEDEDIHVGVVMRRGSNGESVEMGRVQIDNMLHAQVAANAKAMEGGGLMLPLKRASKGKGIQLSMSTGPSGPSQVDGPGDEIKDEDESDVDEDAINSDLDDPDDVIENDDDDDEAGQIMLCMYDKVQRVKNKWKCVLKDGVLNVNGKDYVFHKATGEYEW